jgi:hypothetical protein
MTGVLLSLLAWLVKFLLESGEGDAVRKIMEDAHERANRAQSARDSVDSLPVERLRDHDENERRD